MSTPEPACWSWPVPPVKSLDELAVELAAQDHLDPNDRRHPGLVRFAAKSPGWFQGEQFEVFHAGRCAVCAVIDRYLVDDHDHLTGQVRGLLCRSCNVLEGRSDHPTFELYRLLHPAALLDYHAMYTGVGWLRGWSLVEHRDSVQGVRPATPWPASSREEALRLLGK